MYGFCRITDLGISHFNFSSKNCSSKVYTSFVENVVLVTQSTILLRLHFLDFSMILYGFYKIQSRHTKGGRSILQSDPWKVLTVMPLVHDYTPGKKSK
jgi:hypothetical protein